MYVILFFMMKDLVLLTLIDKLTLFQSNKFVGLPKQWASLVGDQPASSSPHRPSPFIDPSIITPTDGFDVHVSVIWNWIV